MLDKFYVWAAGEDVDGNLSQISGIYLADNLSEALEILYNAFNSQSADWDFSDGISLSDLRFRTPNNRKIIRE